MSLLTELSAGGVAIFIVIALISVGVVLLIMALLAGTTYAFARLQGRGGFYDFNVRPLAWTFGLAVFTIFGFVALPFVSGLTTSIWIQLELIAIGLFVVGGFFGFLFGLPSSRTPTSFGNDAQPLLAPNTHLEEVTAKIATLLTGVALAQIITVPGYILAFNTELQTTLGASAGALGIALLLYFPPLGFVLTYVLMRTSVSELFAKADQRLQLFVSAGSTIRKAPPLPEFSAGSATAEQLDIARTIASLPYTAASDVDDKATWARANALLGNFSQAERAFQDVRVLSPRNYYALLDYATVIYNDPAIDDIHYVLTLLDNAEQCCPTSDLATLSRIKSLRAAALLYQRYGYETSIEEINSLLSTVDMPQPKLARFYRACGFGQLFAALQATGSVQTDVFEDIEQIILNDSALTLAQGKLGRDQLLLVTAGVGRQNGADNDLQAFAAADAPFRSQLQIAAPPTPSPAPPLPVTITQSAISGGWIKQNCPP